MWYWGMGPNTGAWIWMVVMMLLVSLPLIVGAVWLTPLLGARPRDRAGRSPTETPSDVAARRYANGTIDRAQYLQIVEDLAAPHGEAPGARS